MIDRDAIDFQDKDIVLENKHMDLIMKNNQLPLEADIIIKSYPKIEWTLEKCYKEKDDWYFELRGFFDRGIRRVKVKCGEIYRIMGLSVYKFILSCDITEEVKKLELNNGYKFTDVNKEYKDFGDTGFVDEIFETNTNKTT